MPCKGEYDQLMAAIRAAADVYRELSDRATGYADAWERAKDDLALAGIAGVATSPGGVFVAVTAALLTQFPSLRGVAEAARAFLEAEQRCASAEAARLKASEIYNKCVERNSRVPGGPIPK